LSITITGSRLANEVTLGLNATGAPASGRENTPRRRIVRAANRNEEIRRGKDGVCITPHAQFPEEWIAPAGAMVKNVKHFFRDPFRTMTAHE
jgi:hypothetical protein